MRVAALCDVHGNLPALEAVLAEVASLDVDRIVCGGDVVAGPFPRECLDRLVGLDAVFVRGNADRESPRAPEGTWEWIAGNLDPLVGRVPARAATGRFARRRPLLPRLPARRRRDPDPRLLRRAFSSRPRGSRGAPRRRRAHARPVRARRRRDPLRQRRQRRHPVRGQTGCVLGVGGRRRRRLPAHAVRRRRGRGPDSGQRLSRARIRSRAGCSSRRTRTRCPRTSRALPRSFVREARRPVGRRRDRIRPIIERLAVEHADARIALDFRNPLELLVSVMLSAQTTDVNVNRVTERLFEKYRRPEDYLAVPQEELERDVYATGFFRQKAKSIRARCAFCSRSSTARCRARSRSCCGCPASRARPPTSSLRSSEARRESSSTRTCAGSRSGSG